MKKRSHFLDMAILGVLRNRDLHGYEIKRQIVDELGLFTSISFGSMYPALARLERLGLVEVTQGRPRGQLRQAPFTGSLGGERAIAVGLRVTGGADETRSRGKKVYTLTEAGRGTFSGFVNDDFDHGDDDLAFRVRLAFAGALEPEMRLKLLERRRSSLEARLNKGKFSGSRSILDDLYAKCVIEHTQSETVNDISWINELIDSERRRISEHTAQ